MGGYCLQKGRACEFANDLRDCTISACVKSAQLNITIKDDVDIFGTTPEYLAKVLADEASVEKTTDFLERLGISVKTEYGNYRPTYDVLTDIGYAMSRYQNKLS